MKRFYLLIFFSALILNFLQAQVKNIGTPYIQNFTKEDYKSENQNFDIVQDKRGVIYVANLGGVLEYDGNRWTKIAIPNKGAFALAIDSSGRIYTGGKGEFGYLRANNLGEMQYVSLLNLLTKKEDKEEIGKLQGILITEEGICFRTEDALYFLKDNKITIVKNKNKTLLKAFYVNKTLYVHVKKEGLSKYINGKLEKIKLLKLQDHM